MSFVSTDPSNHEGKTNTWLTPLPIIKELGKFDLDPCGYPGHNTAETLYCLPDFDGLKNNWFGRVWLNPPYGKYQQEWLDKMADHGNGIALIFARLETKWIQKYLVSGFFQLEGRIRFLNEEFKQETTAGTGSILIPFGRKNIGSILISDLKGRYYK